MGVGNTGRPAMSAELEVYKKVDGGRLLEHWSCEDDVCGCSQLNILEFHSTSNGRFWTQKVVWEGEFHTDHEPISEAEWMAAVIEADRLGAYVFPSNRRAVPAIGQEGQ